MRRIALAVAVIVVLPGLASAQLGSTNPGTAPTMVPQGHPSAGSPGFAIDPRAPAFDPNRPASDQQRPAQPFTTDPHPLNNAHPATPNAGAGYAGQYGTPVRHVWVQPQVVALQLYVPTPDGVPAQWQTQYAEIPGYFVTETTVGYVYPERWTIEQLNAGVYQWRRLPAEFRAR